MMTAAPRAAHLGSGSARAAFSMGTGSGRLRIRVQGAGLYDFYRRVRAGGRNVVVIFGE